MRVVIVDTYYPAFLDAVYAQTPDLADRGYEEQWRILMNECFGTADFYSRNLKLLGHEATEIVFNCAPLQRRWVAEHAGADASRLREPPAILRHIPRLRQPRITEWLERVLIAQVAAMRPDVVHFQDMAGTKPAVLRALRPFVGAITGQIACEYPATADFGEYDLVLSSFPHFVAAFRQRGWPTAYFRLGFEESIRDRLEPAVRYDAVFIGSVSRDHAARITFLESVARRVPFRWWGHGVDNLAPDSPLRALHQGSAWGLRMYQTLAEARVTLNFHIDVAAQYANNMRLYETTGAGSMLLTDSKKNLSSQFEPGREVAVFDSAEHCAELLTHYLSDEVARARIAAAGLQRTLSEHTYRHRMAEYVSLVTPLIDAEKRHGDTAAVGAQRTGVTS